MNSGTARSATLLIIDETRCHACGRCLAQAACRGNAIRVIDRGEAPFLDTSRCWGCMVCIPACPFGAIVRHNVSEASAP